MRPHNLENIGSNPNSIAALNANRNVQPVKIKMNHVHTLNLIKALESGTHSLQELADITGLSYPTIRQFCSAAHQKKMIHIAEWEKDKRGRDVIIIYKWGSGKDAKRTKIPDALRAKAYRTKLKQQELQTALTIPRVNSAFQLGEYSEQT